MVPIEKTMVHAFSFAFGFSMLDELESQVIHAYPKMHENKEHL